MFFHCSVDSILIRWACFFPESSNQSVSNNLLPSKVWEFGGVFWPSNQQIQNLSKIRFHLKMVEKYHDKEWNNYTQEI